MTTDAWETIIDSDKPGSTIPRLRRVEVPGGWLYLAREIHEGVAIAMQFVPHNDWGMYPSEFVPLDRHGRDV